MLYAVDVCLDITPLNKTSHLCLLYAVDVCLCGLLHQVYTCIIRFLYIIQFEKVTFVLLFRKIYWPSALYNYIYCH